MTVGNNTLYFSYDADGTPMSVNFNGTEYFYTSNIQGDVIGIVNDQGQTVVTYTYDAWGRPLSCTGSMASTLGTINPLRYRGYVYDQDSGLYYLQSRYYNPDLGRFISADSQISGTSGDLLGYNMFAYCFNNPITLEDSTGNWPRWVEKVAKAVAVVAVVATAVVVVAVATAGTGGLAAAAAGVAFSTACGGLVGGIANEKKGESFIKGWGGGAISGFTQSVGTAALGPVGTILGGGIGSGLGTAVTETWNNNGKPKDQKKSSQTIMNDSLKSAAVGTIMSIATAGFGYGIDYAQGPCGYNSWASSLAPGAGIAPITPGFGEMMKGFFSSVDDAMVYIFCD